MSQVGHDVVRLSHMPEGKRALNRITPLMIGRERATPPPKQTTIGARIIIRRKFQ
jgi:hypothetical protein